jgi:hypothetical protein
MQYDCHVTMEMQQTLCHATVPVALLWKCYKDLTCHIIDRFAFQRVHDFDVLFSVHIVGSVSIFI